MMFLAEIIAEKSSEVADRKEKRPLEENQVNQTPKRPFLPVNQANGLQIIAEVKKASPSKGLLCPDFNPVNLAQSYQRAGAAAISVLTDEKFFQGSLEDLRSVKAQVDLPVLRKDFIIDQYQLLEACEAGADAVLLIVAALEEKKLYQLHQEALRLGLTPLVEVHEAEEVKVALEIGATLIGINNRNLKTFEVKLENAFQLKQLIPDAVRVVAESGIRSNADLKRLKAAGFRAALIGETLVTASDPELKLQELLEGV